MLKGHYLIYSLVRLREGKVETRSLLDRSLTKHMIVLYLPLYLLMNPGDRMIWQQYEELLKGNMPYPHVLLPHASVQSSPTRLNYGNSQFIFEEKPEPHYQLHITDPSFQIRLKFRPLKPVSSIDEEATLNRFRYYSITRNQVFGELQQSGMTETLTGEGWIDHQWGRNYGLVSGMGWDWFGLQLEDGRELLISRLRPAHSGSPENPIAKLIAADGAIATSERVSLQPLKYWRSIYSGARYPVEWAISLPDFAMNLHVAPLLNHQEIAIIGPLKAIWEGACSVTGESFSPQGVRTTISGKGFTELVGYASVTLKNE